MKARWIYALGIAAVVGFSIAQIVVRSQDRASIDELVRWEPFSQLGDTPYESRILLDISAFWCAPCRRMQLTTFRDPEFVELLEQWDLRPVRLEYEADKDLEFYERMSHYRVRGLPALVLIDKDGKSAEPIEGLLETQELGWTIERRLSELDGSLHWHGHSFIGAGSPERLTLVRFDSYWYLSKQDRRDWERNPAPEFSRWVGKSLDLVAPTFRHNEYVKAIEFYRDHKIRSAPTMILMDSAGREIRRFEGNRAIQASPAEIARIARERGLDMADPPTPYFADE